MTVDQLSGAEAAAGGVDPLGVLWGKSEEKAGGRMNLLLSHLLDTAAVAERIWDAFLAPSTRHALDGVAGGSGRGRRFFAWLCGVHDCGKATPAFQRMWPKGAAAVRAAGLGWHEPTVAHCRWRHDLAGAYALREILPRAGWREERIAWVWPLVAGHHGAFPDLGATKPPRKGRKQLEGDEHWAAARKRLVERFTVEVGFDDLAAAEPVEVPPRAVQLHLSGLIVMADWIASDERHFPGIDRLADVSIEGARARAGHAWARLGLRGGWGRLDEPGPEAFTDRFGHGPRPSQRLVMDAARQMPAPGLLVVEAPMGEGKTKAALMAAEILAARFGADGVFVGMPTQATSDPMFGQVRQWVGALDEALATRVALLHGKRMFNKEWRDLLEGGGPDPEAPFGGVDEYGECPDDDMYGGAASAPYGEAQRTAARGPAEWFLGAKRGLLCPFVVGTIDQLLFAATRTKHVMLRMAGLAGKVVVLDEVHAADVYMSQFLTEGLRWLGQARVPVVLLSATLPPQQRRALIDAYLAGAASREEFTTADLPEPQGYPSVTSAWVAPGSLRPQARAEVCEGWRADRGVVLDVMPEAIPGRGAAREGAGDAQEKADASVVDRLRSELSEGGCALVIRNTVHRAQALFRALREEFGEEVLLLHGRLAVGPRADRTERCLHLLSGAAGRDGTEGRPRRLIVVATQLAEQSFDVDADLLLTDIAPIDLLLQRIGRLHRHDGVQRPPRLRTPRVVITGLSGAGDDGVKETGQDGNHLDPTGPAPRFLGASEAIYGRHLLLRSAALVTTACEGRAEWRVPGQVPALVASGYGDADEPVPEPWRADAETARTAWERSQAERADKALGFLLTRRGDKEGVTLAGLHYAAVPGGGSDDAVGAVVRDGEFGAEAVLVVHDGATYRTLSGRALTVNGDVPDALLDDVLGGTVRLPVAWTAEAERRLRPLPGWLGHPRLRYSPALVLDTGGNAVLGEHRLHYDEMVGLSPYAVSAITGREREGERATPTESRAPTGIPA
ncbi:CRISPR-associated helicase Cas3' [Streptomyces sp. NPDC002067]